MLMTYPGYVTLLRSSGKLTFHGHHISLLRICSHCKEDRSVLAVCRNAQAAVSVIMLGRDQLEVMSELQHLGSIFTCDCTVML